MAEPKLAELLAAVDAFDGEITQGDWGDRANLPRLPACGCPLTALCVARGVSDPRDFDAPELCSSAAALALGVSAEWVALFISSFDTGPDTAPSGPMEAQKLGTELANALFARGIDPWGYGAEWDLELRAELQQERLS